MKRKIIIGLISLLIIFVLFQVFNSNNQKSDFELAEASIGKVVKEVSENGQVKKGEEISLAFNSAGKIESVYFQKGDKVKKGEVLAKLNTEKLAIQIQEAKADLKVYEAQLAKLLAGSSKEEIKKYETAVSNAQTLLDNARQNLEDVRETSENNLESSYEDAVVTLETSYLKAYNASNFIDSFQRDYFTDNKQESLTVKEAKSIISDSISDMSDSLKEAKENYDQGKIDITLSLFEEKLDRIYELLSDVRKIADYPSYRNVILSADKTSLDTHKSNINTVLSSVISARQTIESTKITNQSNINTALASVSNAEGDLESAKNSLGLITSSPDEEDVNLYEAQVEKAQTKIDYLSEQIDDSYITAPLDGQISEVVKRQGEMVSAGSKVLGFLPESSFQIEVDIYEEDIVKMDVGNPVEISFIAFPEEVFQGEVFFISPVEKIVDGVVYYEVKIEFKEIPEGIKPGMTADLKIETESKENVLYIPESAIQRKEGKRIAKVFKEGEIEEKEIEIGLEGSDGSVEIISGISEGEKVILE